MNRYAHLAFTQTVRGVQRERGSGEAMERLLRGDPEEFDRIGPAEAAFITERDHFYLASVTADGWPYVQHRGGPPGFVHVLDEGTLAYTEVRGNRQYITTGNLRDDDRVSLFFMDYPRRLRLKVMARAEILDIAREAELSERLADVVSDGRPEQLMVLRVEGTSWNCSKHITPRFSEEELADALLPVRQRIAELTAENEALRARLQDR
ncbi:pyridoxamine 5'-phosphate oxidase family protein [Streptomyces sp. AM 2-1-1]|uniref:pyridoxamine 5'-phosphate oxidase family protein n=1 Tax=Streptomyces sp. AM 2-1-1 TaxID=3028709 RepID=UPI0023B93DE7|nr:pyridoxamine 5'-phosphate oxidase family protein [Streptomyces sp. AM 2-1-1]WEH39141.1 pyridoxamine 5'-phosphate oxidase family protein [Streptomyces sp. AM 2-1-1]